MDDEHRQHLEDLRQHHQRRLRQLERQQATFGVSTPPEIALEIEDIHAKIAHIDADLKQHVSASPQDTPVVAVRSHQYMPTPLTALIGRERELVEISTLLQGADVRLVTLTGPGGAGKTRLGIQVIAELRDHFADGGFFIDLAPVNHPTLVSATIAHALGLPAESGQTLIEHLKRFLRPREILLLLDNFEHVVEAAPLIGDLLQASSGLKVLVTSRSILKLRGEYEYVVPPLAFPDPHHMPPLERLTEYAAVQLFIARAQAVKSNFVVSYESAQAVAEICTRMDGLPLAIELVAARIKILPPQKLLERLGSRLTPFLSGVRDHPTRHQTLRSTIDWSYNLLDAAEQTLFARLSVFVGGCTIAAAEAVCTDDELLALDVLEGVASLVDKSLLRHIDGTNGEPRFVMLETIREYAAERLEIGSEDAIIRQKHATYFWSFVQAVEATTEMADRPPWQDQIEQEYDNVRAALGWAVQQREVDMGLTLGRVLFDYQLGDTIGLMAQLLRGGYSLIQTIQLVEQHTAEPTTSAFQQVLQAVREGQSLQQALDTLLVRIPSDHLQLLIATLDKQQKEGGNLAQMLEPLSQTLRRQSD